MINTFGFDVSVVVNATVSATQLSYRVSAPLGILQDWDTLALTGTATAPGPIALNIDKMLNEVTQPQIPVPFGDFNFETPVNLPLQAEGRVVEVRLLDANDNVLQFLTLDYTLNGGLNSLQIMGNTFQTYPEAIGWASGIKLTTWPSSNAEDRVSALITAFNSLARLSYDLYEDFNDADEKNRAGWGFYNFDQVMNLSLYTAEELNNLRPDFVRTLKIAQVVEADCVLTNDPDEDARDAGITSEVIGPASTNYRTTKPVTYSINRRTVRVLGGFLNKSPRLTRL